MYLKKLFQSPKNIFLSGILTPVSYTNNFNETQNFH